jgi:hypothetical protein
MHGRFPVLLQARNYLLGFYLRTLSNTEISFRTCIHLWCHHFAAQLWRTLVTAIYCCYFQISRTAGLRASFYFHLYVAVTLIVHWKVPHGMCLRLLRTLFYLYCEGYAVAIPAYHGVRYYVGLRWPSPHTTDFIHYTSNGLWLTVPSPQPDYIYITSMLGEC